MCPERTQIERIASYLPGTGFKIIRSGHMIIIAEICCESSQSTLRCSLSMYTTQLHLSHLKGLTSPEEINTVRRSSGLNTKRHCLFWRLREKTTPCLDSVYFVDSVLLATACPVLRLTKAWPLQGSWNNP